MASDETPAIHLPLSLSQKTSTSGCLDGKGM